jgi:hypothetical protein
MLIYTHNLSSQRARHYLSGDRKNRSTAISRLFPGKSLLCHGEGNDMLKVSSINQIKRAHTNRLNTVCPIDGRARFQADSGNADILGLDATNRPPRSRQGSKLILPKIRN